MIPVNPKVGEIYSAFGTHYKVLSVNADGTFVSEIQNGIVDVAETKKAEPINETAVKVEPIKVVAKKPTTKKTTVKKK